MLCSFQGPGSVVCRAGARAACAAWRVSSSRRGRSSSPLVAAARRGRLPCRGFCRSSRRGVSHPLSSWSVVVAARVRRCLSVSWRPCRRACGGLPSGLCRWPYLACAWRLAPPGCLWRPCRRGPGVRGRFRLSFVLVASRYHFFRRLFNVKSTNDFVTLLCVCDKSQNIKMAVLLLFRALRRAHIVEARFRRVRAAWGVPAFPARRCSFLSEWQALDAARPLGSALAGAGASAGRWRFCWRPLACSGGCWRLWRLLACSGGCWRALAAAGGSGVLCWPLALLLAAGGSGGCWLAAGVLWRLLAGSAGRWRLWRLLACSGGRWRALAAAGASAGGGWPLACSGVLWRLWRPLACSGVLWRLLAALAALAAAGVLWRALAAAGGSAGRWRFCWRLARRAADPPGFPCRRACRFLVFCGFPTTFALQNRALFVQKGGAGRIAGPTSKGPRPPHARNAEGFEWGVS